MKPGSVFINTSTAMNTTAYYMWTSFAEGVHAAMDRSPYCFCCWQRWPCPTVRELTT